jgi:hypothetical protein
MPGLENGLVRQQTVVALHQNYMISCGLYPGCIGRVGRVAIIDDADSSQPFPLHQIVSVPVNHRRVPGRLWFGPGRVKLQERQRRAGCRPERRGLRRISALPVRLARECVRRLDLSYYDIRKFPNIPQGWSNEFGSFGLICG